MAKRVTFVIPGVDFDDDEFDGLLNDVSFRLSEMTIGDNVSVEQGSKMIIDRESSDGNSYVKTYEISAVCQDEKFNIEDVNSIQMFLASSIDTPEGADIERIVDDVNIEVG